MGVPGIEGEFEVHNEENFLFHGDKFISSVGATSIVYEFIQRLGVDLFIFGGHKETGHCQELTISRTDVLYRFETTIEHLYCHEDGFSFHL